MGSDTECLLPNEWSFTEERKLPDSMGKKGDSVSPPLLFLNTMLHLQVKAKCHFFSVASFGSLERVGTYTAA